MPKEAQDLATILELLEAHPRDGQHRIVQYLVSKYGLMPVLTREYERLRKADLRSVPENVRDNVLWGSPGQSTTGPAPVVKASSSGLLFEAVLEEARRKLDRADCDFLAACPEPFRTAWLSQPEWWISLKDGYPRLHHQQEASRCMGWVQSRFPTVAAQQRLNLRVRLRSWFAKADGWRLQNEERKAVRR